MKPELIMPPKGMPRLTPGFQAGDHCYPWRFGREPTARFRTRDLSPDDLSFNATLQKPDFVLVDFVRTLRSGSVWAANALDPHPAPILVMDFDRDKQCPDRAPGGASWDEFETLLAAKVEPVGGIVLRSPSGAVKAFFKLASPVDPKDHETMRAVLFDLASRLFFPMAWIWKECGPEPLDVSPQGWVQAWDVSWAAMTVCFFTNPMIAAWKAKQAGLREQVVPIGLAQNRCWKNGAAAGGSLSFRAMGAVGGRAKDPFRNLRSGANSGKTGSQVNTQEPTCPTAPTTKAHSKTRTAPHRFRGRLPDSLKAVAGKSPKRQAILRIIMASHGLLKGSPLPQASIAKAAKASQLGVSRVIADLMEAGLLVRGKKAIFYPKAGRGLAAAYRATGPLRGAIAQHHGRHGTMVADLERLQRESPLRPGTWHSGLLLSYAHCFAAREDFLAFLVTQGLDTKKDRRHHANRAFDKVDAHRLAQELKRKATRAKQSSRG